jgi:hypothetical protein
MSIASMADAAVQRKRTDSDTRSTGAGTRTITPLKGATDLARYIPTEAIAIYLAILTGAFAPLSPIAGKKSSDLDYTSRWHFYLIMLVATAALVWLMYAAKTRGSATDRRKHDVPVFEMAIAVAAMAAWEAALPDTPFADFSWYGGWFAAIVLSTTVALLPLVATALGKSAPSYDDPATPPAGG